jgi:hypothetical protein
MTLLRYVVFPTTLWRMCGRRRRLSRFRLVGIGSGAERANGGRSLRSNAGGNSVEICAYPGVTVNQGRLAQATHCSQRSISQSPGETTSVLGLSVPQFLAGQAPPNPTAGIWT